MKRLLFAFLLACGATFASAPTHIQDTWVDTNNNPLSGTLTVSWPSFIEADGTVINGGQFTKLIQDGVIDFYIAPNAGASTNQVGTSTPPLYLASFFNSANSAHTYSTWSVPVSGSPVNLAAILCTNACVGSSTGSGLNGTISAGNVNQLAIYAAAGIVVSGGPSLVTTLGNPGLDTNVASERAIRTAIAAAVSGLSPTLSFTGSGSKVASATGAGTANNCAKWDSSGNVVDAGAPCGTSSGGSGTVTSGTTGQFAYYSADGTTVGGRTLVAGDIPSLGYDASGAAATAQSAAQTSGLQKSNNLSDLVSASTARTNLGLGTIATQAASAFQAALTFTGNGTQTASSTGSKTTNDCAKWDVNGNIVDAGSPCGSGSGSTAWSALTAGTNTSGAFVIGSGASIAATGSGTIAATSVPAGGVTGLAASATTDTTNASNISSGTLNAARLPATAVVTGSASGTGSKYASATAAGTANNCAKWDASGNIIDAGAPCGSSSGGDTITSPNGTMNIGGTSTNTTIDCVAGSSGALNCDGPGVDIVTSVVPRMAAANTFTGLNKSGVSSTATGSNNYAPYGWVDESSVWNGSAATTDDWVWVPVIGTGANPTTTFTLTHTSSATGTASVNIPFAISVTSCSGCGVGGSLLATNNLSDLANKSISRTNLGVGPAFQSNVYLAHGDSITQGYLASGVASTTCGSCTYEATVGTYLNATVTNAGNPSRSACDLDDQSIFPNSTLATTDTNQIFSLMVGTNDVDLHYSTYNTDGYGAMFSACHQAAVAWLATTNKYAANASNCTDTGTWAAWLSSGNGSSPLVGEYSITPSSTKTCPITTTGAPIYVWSWVAKNSTGTASYSVDSGVATGTWTASGPVAPTSKISDFDGWQLIRIPIAAGHHSIVFTVTAGSTNNGVIVEAIGTPVPATQQGPKVFVSGVPKQQGDGNSAATAYYDGLVQADTALLANDGLPVTFVPIRNYLCTSVVSGSCYNAYGQLDMNNGTIDPPSTSGYGLHPNQQGHTDLKQAFLETMQITPYPATSGGSPSFGSVTGGTNTSAAMVVGSGASLAATGSGTIAATSVPVAGVTSLAFSGSTTKAASTTGSITTNDCAKWDASGNIIDAGAACGSGSGGPTTPGTTTTGNVPQYSNTTGTALSTGLGVVTTVGSPGLDTNLATEKAVRTAIAGVSGGAPAFSTVTSGTNTSAAMVVGSGGSLAATGSGTIAATSVAAAGLPATTMQTNQSNTVTTGTQDFSAATHTLPTAVGLGSAKPGTCQAGELYFATDATAGQNLAECGSTNNWTQESSGSGGSGTVNSGTSGQIAYYASTGTAVSGETTIPDTVLPADQCVLTKYTVAYTALTGAASATPTSTVATLAGTSTRICYLEIAGTTSFAGTSLTAMTVRLQSGAGTPMLYTPNQDVFGTVGSTTNNYWVDSGATADRTNQSVVAAFTLTGAVSSALTAGSVDLVVGVRTRP